MSAGAAGSGGWEGRWVGVAPWCAVVCRGGSSGGVVCPRCCSEPSVAWREARSRRRRRRRRVVELVPGPRRRCGPRGKRTAAMAAPPSLPQPPQTAPLSPPSRPVGSAVVRHPWRRTAAATTQNSLVFFSRMGTPVVWVRPQVGGRRWLRVAHGCSTWFSGCLSRASSRFFKPAWLLRFSRRAMVPVAYQLAMALAHGAVHARCSLVEPRQGIRRESREHENPAERSTLARRSRSADECAGSEQFPPHVVW